MNIVHMMGRLTKDPEVLKDGELVKYDLAVDREYANNGDENVDFFRCTCFKQSAAFATKYLKKGIKIIVHGRLKNSSYTNNEGNKVYTTEIIVSSQEFAESKRSHELTAPEATAPEATAPEATAPEATAPKATAPKKND